MNRSMVTISKFLSKHLRHTPETLGLTLQPGGWVSVDELMSGCEQVQFAITYDELIECVETSDKQRFSFDPTGDLIRANQGHSVEVDLELEAKRPPDVLYHGTVATFIPSIMVEGLQKRQRHHVHLTNVIDTARKVGARRGKPVILQVDAETMHAKDYEFYESANGVWLTHTVPAEFLRIVDFAAGA